MVGAQDLTSNEATTAEKAPTSTTRQRTGWVIAVTLTALTVLIVVVLHAVGVL